MVVLSQNCYRDDNKTTQVDLDNIFHQYCENRKKNTVLPILLGDLTPRELATKDPVYSHLAAVRCENTDEDRKRIARMFDEKAGGLSFVDLAFIMSYAFALGKLHREVWSWHTEGSRLTFRPSCHRFRQVQVLSLMCCFALLCVNG